MGAALFSAGADRDPVPWLGLTTAALMFDGYGSTWGTVSLVIAVKSRATPKRMIVAIEDVTLFVRVLDKLMVTFKQLTLA